MIRRLLAVAALAAATGSARADTGTATSAADAEQSKKQRWLAGKDAAPDAAARTAWERQLQRRLGKPAEPVINVVNGWTHEVLVVPEHKGKLKDDLPARPLVDRFLRCRFTNKATQMDARLMPTVIAAARHFKSRRAVIVSAFRSDKYNLMLRKKGRQVSRDSRHIEGKAIDFRLDNVSARDLDSWAKGLAMGGVGFYGDSAFIHVDTDRIRYWTGE